MKIDLELLKTQKAELLDAIELYEGNEWRKEAIDAFNGIVSMLDSIQDKLEDEKPINFEASKLTTNELLEELDKRDIILDYFTFDDIRNNESDNYDQEITDENLQQTKDLITKKLDANEGLNWESISRFLSKIMNK